MSFDFDTSFLVPFSDSFVFDPDIEIDISQPVSLGTLGGEGLDLTTLSLDGGSIASVGFSGSVSGTGFSSISGSLSAGVADDGRAFSSISVEVWSADGFDVFF